MTVLFTNPSIKTRTISLHDAFSSQAYINLFNALVRLNKSGNKKRLKKTYRLKKYNVCYCSLHVCK